MAILFISYAAEDGLLARAIAQGLEVSGYTTWYYERDSYPGASYLGQILAALAEASALLVVLSPLALGSHQIDREIIQAHETNTPIVPIFNGISHEELRERRPEWAMAIGARVAEPVPPDGVAALLPRLLAGLQRVVEPHAAAAPGPIHVSDETPEEPVAGPSLHDNLPVEVTSFVGRAHEQDAVGRLLERARMVTLRGPGGVGKTRLALQVAAAQRQHYPDGVWLVELAALTEAALVSEVVHTLGVREAPARALDPATLVVSTVAKTLGVREQPGRSLLDVLIAALAGRTLLLVLDNCEHLIAACATLCAALLRSCPGVRVLATSREGLDVAGEYLYLVTPLKSPDPAHLPSLLHIAEFDAVRLFVERAQARRPDFALAAHNIAPLAAICRNLDGIPLAIELAAARVGALSVEGIAARLSDRFRLLTNGPRTALPQQQTLRATLDWSYDLLTRPEQVLLQRLAVFSGGFTLTMAEAICAGDSVEEWEMLDLLASLANKSLVQEEDERDEARYTLLATVRQYAMEKQDASDRSPALRDRHLRWFISYAEHAAAALLGPEQGVWLARLEREHDNLRAALMWAQESVQAEPGLRLGSALWRFWFMHGYLSEGRTWLDGLLSLDVGDDPAVQRARAKALNGAGVLAGQQGDLARAQTLYDESLDLARNVGDVESVALVLNNLGVVAMRHGDYAGAVELLEESLTLHRDRNDRWGIALALQNLGVVAGVQGDLARVTTLFEESLTLHRALGDKQGIADMLTNLGLVARDQGDYARALALSRESLSLYEALGDRWHIANLLSNMGSIALCQKDYAAVEDLCTQSLALFDTGWSNALAVECFDMLARVAFARGHHARAAHLGGAAAAARQRIGASLSMAERTEHERFMAALQTALGDSFTLEWEVGQDMSIEQAIALAKTIASSDTDAPASTGRGDIAACGPHVIDVLSCT